MGTQGREPRAGRPCPAGREEADGGVVELPVLLSGRHAAALEEAAHRAGLTAAQLLREILRRHLECEKGTDTE